MEFKNKQAKRLCETIIDAIPDLDSRKKGYVARSMMLLVADAYFEDRPAIFEAFEVRFKESRNPNTIKDPNAKPPKVFADAKQRPEAIKAATAKAANSRVATSSSEGNCANCDDDIKKEYQKAVAKSVEKDLPDDMLESPEALLDAFDYDQEELLSFARSKGIKTGNAKKPESIASIIIKKLNNV